MFNKKCITYNFLIFKWQLHNNLFTEKKYFLEKDYKMKAVKSSALNNYKSKAICQFYRLMSQHN